MAVAAIAVAGLAPLATGAETLEYVGSVVISAADPDGEFLSTPLIGGRRYLFLATGVYSYGPAGLGDAECSQAYDEPQPRRERYGTETLDLLIGNYAHEWVPNDGYYGRLTAGTDDAVRDAAGCSATHSYRYSVVAAPGPVNFRISDVWHGDNSGDVTVSVYRYSLSPIPNEDGDLADAECSSTRADPISKRARYGPAELDLVLNGYSVEWKSVHGTTVTDCNEQSTYQITLWAVENSKVSYRIFDSTPGNNSGYLSVTVIRG